MVEGEEERDAASSPGDVQEMLTKILSAVADHGHREVDQLL